MTVASQVLSEPKTLRKIDFAKRVGVTPGRVSQMVKDGLPVEPDGRIDVARGQIWIKANISPTRSAAQSDQNELPFAAQKDAAEERLRLIKEQADGQALKNEQMRRNLLPAPEVERAWSDVMRTVRAGILAVPARLRQTMPHLTPQDFAMLDAELRRALEDLANGK